MARIDHIGIVVDDLTDAKRFLTEALGLTLDRELDLTERQIRAAFLSYGDVSLEFIEVDEPAARRQRLGDGAMARVEHIAIEVDDLEESIARLRGFGVRTTTDLPRRTGSTLNFWTEPESSDGVSYQIFARDE